MLPLQYIQRSLETFGFCTKEFDGFDFRATLVRFIISFIITVMALIPSTHYMYLNAEDTETIILALTPIVAYFLVLASYVTFIFENKMATDGMQRLKTLVQERKCS